MRHPHTGISHNSVVICERSVRSAIGGRNWMALATKVLLYKQTIDNFLTRPAPWRYLSGNRVLFVLHSNTYNNFYLQVCSYIH